MPADPKSFPRNNPNDSAANTDQPTELATVHKKVDESGKKLDKAVELLEQTPAALTYFEGLVKSFLKEATDIKTAWAELKDAKPENDAAARREIVESVAKIIRDAGVAFGAIAFGVMYSLEHLGLI